MSNFLIFTLESHLASFGDLAGFERRGTGSWPAKSALIGILGASLGVRREDEKSQDELRALSFAVAVFDSGIVIRDFHTAQAVHQKVKRPATRAIALEKGAKAGAKAKAVNAVLTQRDYRCGVSYGVAVWGEGADLPTLVAALENPVFVPYLGRKSCPLSSPFSAKIVTADNPVLALEETVLPPWRLNDFGNGMPTAHLIATDPHEAIQADYIENRYDIPVDRQRWHFQTREVHMIRGMR